MEHAIVKEGLTISLARRIIPVVTTKNVKTWVEKALTLSQAELERAVSKVNPKARIKEGMRTVAPELLEMRLGITPDLEKKLKRLQSLLSTKLRRPVTLSEAIAWAADTTLDKHDPVKKAERASSRKQKPVTTAKPTVTQSPIRRKPIPARVNHALTLRDGARCTHRGPDGRRCESTTWLERHHIIPVRDGGTNDLTNLTLRCSAHHRLHHERVGG